ncbi:hypothetical protein A3D84_05750 [Candidatus Woesebacteria bacterium RIFCSPHIGHO2_02_FULL_42_20]|uniref:Uncharacterized protein n=1 Tax=Candidatus Woesebacteria bacterium RIFCSPHIGHO2_12_FULL_41_24 TaxID=1802510 RepID=A0A1F8AU56_9BACT|nr:MAG: hypothetical protein A2W15_01310 [Candidatus Woesebacteria bacterium RBG_16_41_13]OGM30408.1 MAG: hypothetical protein A2873_00435 [Candidatus Woesebacteria bacterium RIFCSPHIGHO2_01_FULL_42_80]OGM35454.1 MAG: hypothetical protein A3D84_05750 [Candidatus Woesebacteria bacterium RIFCSPHIGHO2_02_FULL_42_20]OGM55029.1 MAG: hypothetical protein A3E44_04735 [Candidatus Woesebacteria bacterium RIFCSPHIGHO2_12_FULL_41_24]OGM66375.1 MAG: hypothetical protein A2969_00355 [Candidatus Woesebacteri
MKKKKYKRFKKLSRKQKIFLILLAGFILICMYLFYDIPSPFNLNSDQISVSTKLMDRNGKLFYEIYTDERRTPIELTDLPPYVIEATLAIEDKDFYNHHGFSVSGITRAFYNTLFRGKLQGGSTLTQQFVKNALLTQERTIRRKAQEFVLTIAVELVYSKDQILEMYLNQIPYGSTAYGIQAASELYFGKNAEDLSVGEAALLAGLPAAPTRFSPFGANPQSAKVRQELVLAQMREEGFIDKTEETFINNEKLNYADIEAPAAAHFSLWVKELLVNKYGEKLVEKGGLRVTTTLDIDLQEFAQETARGEIDDLANFNVKNAAVLVTKPETGEILAMVGSKDWNAEDEDGRVNIIFAKRQPGSSIKPINYALAIKDGKITPSTAITDVPTCFSVTGQALYCPGNYDGSFHGLTQVRFALGNSYNVPAVKVLALNGIENFIGFARDMGITTFEDPAKYGLSLTLGGGEVRPYDMAVAFAVFANSGVRQNLNPILKVEDWKGKVYEEFDVSKVEGIRVLSPDVTFLISHILHDNNARSDAFGAGSLLNVRGHGEVSVKTGTTNDRRDNWTIGYTKDALAVVWVGNNDNTPMKGSVSGVSGASPIWNAVMSEALEKYEPEENHPWPKAPDTIIGRSVCWTTGLLSPGSGTCPERFEYFLQNYLPDADSGIRQDIPVDKTTHTVARPDTPPENIEIQNHPVYYDPLKTIYCLDCAIPTQSITIRYPLGEN